MTRTIVLDEHTLGVVYPNELQILRSSVLRGSPHPAMGTIAFHPSLTVGRFRPATEQDFNDFGVVFHPDYLAVDSLNRPLDPVEKWMAEMNLQYVENEGIDVVVARLRANGYDRVASVVQDTHLIGVTAQQTEDSK